MRAYQLLLPLTTADLTFYTAQNGDVITIDPGCPTIYPKNTDKQTNLPYWYKECPPIDLCHPGITLNKYVKPYSARCKDDDGNKWNDGTCCSNGWTKLSACYGYCQPNYATNLDGKSKVNWQCMCNKAKGCRWDIQGSINDLICTECEAVKKLDWTTSGQKQADYNADEGALGVNGKILSAGWIHKNQNNENTEEYYIVISVQGIELSLDQIMVWNYDVHEIYSEPFGTNQWYTFAQTMIILKPNAQSPQGPFAVGDVTNIVVGLENIDDLTQVNIDSGMVHYSVGYLGDFVDLNGNDWDFSCILSHFGANPGKNDMAMSDLIPIDDARSHFYNKN